MQVFVRECEDSETFTLKRLEKRKATEEHIYPYRHLLKQHKAIIDKLLYLHLKWLNDKY